MFIIIILLLLLPISAFADTHAAADCNASSINTAIGAAVDGDIVTVPAGTCTWTTTVSIPNTKGIKLRGTGTPASPGTIISASVDSGYVMSISTSSDNSQVELSGFKITTTGGAGDQAILLISGNATDWIVHDNWFVNDHKTRAVYFYLTYPGRGVFYSNTVDTNYPKQGMQVDSSGAASWSAAMGWGGADATYIEGNTINNLSEGGELAALDCGNGGRLVFRYNTMHSHRLTNHGFDSSGVGTRGCMKMEIYYNLSDSSLTTGDSCSSNWGGGRGGTFLIYNNTITGNSPCSSLTAAGKVYRAPVSTGYPPDSGGTLCDGSNDYDQNNVMVTGTCAGTCSDTQVRDGSAPGWTNDEWFYNATYGMKVFNTTRSTSAKITDNTTDTITASGGGLGFQVGDTYEIRGYACLDQVGRGTDQGLEPVYIWGNTYNGSSNNTMDPTARFVVENRDYYLGSAKEGYSAYTCPHPNTGSGSCTTTRGVEGYVLGGGTPIPTSITGVTITGGTIQ